MLLVDAQYCSLTFDCPPTLFLFVLLEKEHTKNMLPYFPPFFVSVLPPPPRGYLIPSPPPNRHSRRTLRSVGRTRSISSAAAPNLAALILLKMLNYAKNVDLNVFLKMPQTFAVNNRMDNDSRPHRQRKQSHAFLQFCLLL